MDNGTVVGFSQVGRTAAAPSRLDLYLCCPWAPRFLTGAACWISPKGSDR